MIKVVAYLIVMATSLSLRAQFYPASNAGWCLEDQGSIDNAVLFMEMPRSPDTLINGQTYQMIMEYGQPDWGASLTLLDRHYVRSAIDGKGYVLRLDDMTEYLTGDAAALAGDTVYNVLAWNSSPECAIFQFNTYDIVVDSVVILDNEGVEVSRHYVHTTCYNNSNGIDPHRFFWQAGMGTFSGPFLQIRSGLSPLTLSCATADSITQYGFLGGLPGGPFCCYQIGTGGTEAAMDPVPNLSLFPSPVEDQLIIELSDKGGADGNQIRLYDTNGRLALSTSMQGGVHRIDVSTLCGLYTVVVENSTMRYQGRVVVLNTP